MEYFNFQRICLKFISMLPLNIDFVPEKFRRFKFIINIIYKIFWHFVVLHLALLQIQTLLMNLDKSLDELIDYLMIGGIYCYGYFFLWHFQLRWKKILNLMEFVETYFRKRSAKGKNASFYRSNHRLHSVAQFYRRVLHKF